MTPCAFVTKDGGLIFSKIAIQRISFDRSFVLFHSNIFVFNLGWKQLGRK